MDKAIERHFITLPSDEIRDDKVSITKIHLREIADFAEMIHASQEAYLSLHVPERSIMMGKSTRNLSDAELLNRAYHRGRFCNKNGNHQRFNWEAEGS